ncbi:MAG: hypothetical protein L0196_07560 [candidate division Zixibacteria bacterium]|nr:hypothetical protein [candidate division Zixibacteria bacterium]
MKRMVAVLLIAGSNFAFAQGPDPRDSVIVESKAISPGLVGSPAFTLKVYITNKDTLANFTLPVEIRTIDGAAFVVLGYPRTFAGTCNRLTGTLGDNPVFSPFVNSANPDSAVWSAFWDPRDTSTAEPPNPTRKAFWELKFDSVRAPAGEVQIDSAQIFDNQVGFVSIAGEPVEANFVRGIVAVSAPFCDLGCPHPDSPIEVLYGRPASYNFDDCGQTGSWSMVSGPGTIDPNTGMYSFSGACNTGNISVGVRFTPGSGSPSDCSFQLKVKDTRPSSSPEQNVITVSHGQTATNQINASDPDAGDGFVFSKLSGPGTVASNGSWSYPTGCADVGISPRTIQIKTSDAFGSCSPGPLADTSQFQLVVTNATPAFTDCPGEVLTADTGTAFSRQLSAADADLADAGNLLFSVVSGPAGFSVSPSGLAQWTPAGSQTGLQSATLQVRDLCGAFSNCRLDFAVSLRKGDLNGDGALSGADLVLIINCNFADQPPPAGRWACDVNCSGYGSPSDVVSMIDAIFREVPFPC